MTEHIEIEPVGVMLKEDFLDDIGISVPKFAQAIGVTRQEIYKIISGDRKVSPEMSIRFGMFFGMSLGYWNRLQNDYDMRIAKREKLDQFKQSIKPMQVA